MFESDLDSQRDRFTALMDTWESLSDDRKKSLPTCVPVQPGVSASSMPQTQCRIGL